MDSVEYHKLGFIVSDTGDNKLQVQKIDFPEKWKEDNGHDFDIPQLESDEKAWKIATKIGLKLDIQGFILK